MTDPRFIRNFSIVAHIDHGKTTLSDRILQRCNAVTAREMHEQMLDDMAAAYAKKGVQFVGVNSNKTETVQDVVDHAKKHGHTFTIVKDPDNKVADLYDASHTPEVYVVDKAGKLRYHGRIDENSDDASKVTSPDLKNALDALLGGQTVAKAETKAFGCSIKRV